MRYVIDLPPYFEITSTFNISDLVAYKCSFFNPDNPLMNLDEPNPEPYLRDSTFCHCEQQLTNLQQSKLIA